MASAETVMAVYSDREDKVLESRMRSKDSCPVWGEGAGKVPDGNSPTPYSTARPVLGARGGETPPRDSSSVPDDRRPEALALAGRRPGWGRARRLGPEPAGQTGRQAPAPQAAEKADAASACHGHGQAGELQRHEGRGDALGRAPEA